MPMRVIEGRYSLKMKSMYSFSFSLLMSQLKQIDRIGLYLFRRQKRSLIVDVHRSEKGRHPARRSLNPRTVKSTEAGNRHNKMSCGAVGRSCKEERIVGGVC